MSYRRQLLGVLYTELQSDQPATSLAVELDGSLCEQTLQASTRLCKHIRHACQSFLDTVGAPCARCIRGWGRPHWSPCAMSAVTLTHCTKSLVFFAQNYEHLRRNKRQGVKDRETSLQQLRLQPLYSLGKNSRPAFKSGGLELSLPPKYSTPICRKMSRHNISPDQQIPEDMRTH